MNFRRAVEFAHRTRTSAMTDMCVERALPDYTWPQRMPIEQLRRTVKRELKEAADMAAQILPHWRATA